MLPEPVIDRQVARQPTIAFLCVLEGHPVGPFPAEGLNESLGFAVGAGRVGPGPVCLRPRALHALESCVRRRPDRYLTSPAGTPHPGCRPSHSTAQKADGGGLLIIRQHLDVGHAGGVVDGHVDTVVADSSRAALLAAAGDAVTDPAKAGKLFDVDMDQVSGMVPLVALERRLGFQIPESAQVQQVQGPGHGGERGSQHPSDVPQVQSLMTELHGLLLLLRIERPPLGAVNTALIRQ